MIKFRSKAEKNYKKMKGWKEEIEQKHRNNQRKLRESDDWDLYNDIIYRMRKLKRRF